MIIMDDCSGAKGRRNKMLKLEEKEDGISDLPDSLLQHILSLLPSTKQAIQTDILSKRWKNQWTRVPVLIFDSGTSSDISVEDFARFIDSTLLQHDCSKIKKLHLAYNFEKDANFSRKIHFVTRKHVEELILHCYCSNPADPYMLPEFLFDNASLVRLEMIYCYFRGDWSINWGSLKAFKMEGYTCRNLVANVLSGSPSLELLELNPRGGGDYAIASKSLKILIFVEVDIEDDNHIEISCPNLEELYVKAASDMDDSASLPDKTIENVVSCCPLLRSLELKNCYFEKLVIVSKSLKKLVLRYLNQSCAIEISCPNLEHLNVYGFCYETFKLMNIPFLICAALDFEIPPYVGCGEDMAKHIFELLQNVKELTMGNWFIEILSDVEMGGVSYPWSNNKILTLDGPNFEHLHGIVCALRSSPMLERLVIRLLVYERRTAVDLLDLNDSRENYWNSNTTVSNCLVSHLRTVKIVGLSKRDAKCKLVLDFIEFLLKNAGGLEKLVVMISKDRGKDFAFAVSQKVSSFPRCSQHAIVELLCCTETDTEADTDTDTDTETDTGNVIFKT